MGYIRQGFADGQKLKAEHLTHIEDGIIALEETQQSLGGQIAAAEESIEEFRFVVSASGERIVANDTSNRTLRGLTVYGKSVQDGTPTPDAPVPIVSAGAEGGAIQLYIPQAFETATIIRHPRDYTAPEGASVTFSVIAGGKDLTYQWRFKTVNGVWKDCTTPDFDKPEMTLEALTTRDGNRYHCVVTDSNGKSVTSRDAYLNLGDQLLYGEYVYADTAQLTIPTPGGLPGLPVSSGGKYTDENGQMWLSNTKGVNEDVDVVKLLELTADMNFQQDNTFTMDDGTVLHRYSVIKTLVDFDYLAGVTERLIFSHGRYRGTNMASGKTDIIPGDMFAFSTTTASNCWVGFFVAIPTLEEFKAWLTAQKEAGTPPTVVYKLKEPIVTEHDAIELPHTYKPNTTIVNDAGAYMEVEYVADPKTYIDNKFAQLAVAVAGN